MSVKRYSVGVDGVDPNGNLVKYTDYAALEARCAALAAENAGLKAAALDEIEVINRGGQAYCVKDGVSVNPIYARGWNDHRAKALSVETPATDAFLAEVRSRAVDEVCLKISNSIPNCYQDELVGLDMAATICGDFASELRKGVQS